MGSASRLLCMFLAVLLAFAGGALDLCACDASSHGAFCADAGQEAARSCHGERAPTPAPVEKHGCCGGGEPAPAGEALEAAGCGCPVLVIEQPPSEQPVASSAKLDRTSELHVATPTLPLGWVAPEGETPRDEPWRRPPRVPALRRHLELHVLRH